MTTTSRRALVALLAVASLATVAVPRAAAQAPGEVDLRTEIAAGTLPVAGSTMYASIVLTNDSDVDATGVELEARVPAGVSVEVLELGCTTDTGPAETVVTCPHELVAAREQAGMVLRLVFPATGTYELSSDARADQPDSDGTATSSLEVTVVEEESDLTGDFSDFVTGVGGVERVTHTFWSLGPTAASGAQISGTFMPGATLVPGTFFFGWVDDRSSTDCTVTATTYTCGPVGSAPNDFVDAYITYEVVLPTAGTYEATATITGRNDPDPSNDTSLVRFRARQPAPDLWAVLDVPYTWVGQETWEVAVNASNMGELPADDVDVTLSVSAGWAVGLPTDPDPPGRSCTLAADELSVTCTFDEVPPSAVLYSVPVTSPSGPAPSGEATLTVASPTPEHPDFPNTATAPLPHFGPLVAVVEPSSALVDRQEVTVEVGGFPPSTGIGTALCTADPRGLSDCEFETITLANTDASGGASLARTVSRFIVTPNSGVVDCTVEACAVAVATQSLSMTTSAPITFGSAPPASAGLGLVLGAPSYLAADPSGDVTIPVTLTCASATTVDVQFVVDQIAGGGYHWDSAVRVPCTPGSPVAVTSDLTGSPGTPFTEGDAQVLVRASAGAAFATVGGDTTIESQATMLAILQARLADPSDTTVLTEFYDSLAFRLQYNPRFARAFWRAILAPPG